MLMRRNLQQNINPVDRLQEDLLLPPLVWGRSTFHGLLRACVREPRRTPPRCLAPIITGATKSLLPFKDYHGIRILQPQDLLPLFHT